MESFVNELETEITKLKQLIQSIQKINEINRLSVKDSNATLIEYLQNYYDR